MPRLPSRRRSPRPEPPAPGAAPPPYGYPTQPVQQPAPPQPGPAYAAPQAGLPPQAYGAPQPVAMLGPNEERTWAGAAHWSALAAALIGGLSFLGPLFVLLIQGNKSPFVRRHAVESLNFQLSLLIYAIVSAILILVLVGIFLLIAVGLMWLIFPIIGTIKASNGEDYRYPLCIRMVS